MNTPSQFTLGRVVSGSPDRVWTTAALSLIFALTSVAQDFSAQNQLRMTRIVCRYSGPNIAPDSLQTQTLTIYRAGNKYERVEHPPDATHKTHRLEITSEPDAWYINLADQTAVHVLDKGPDFSVRHHILSLPSGQTDPAFVDLEFGKEAIFARQAQAKEIGMRKIDNQEARVFVAKGGDREATLFFDSATDKPLRIEVTKNGKADMTVDYMEFEIGLPFDPTLFELPKGIKITEQK
jgi:hypothetical protein